MYSDIYVFTRVYTCIAFSLHYYYMLYTKMIKYDMLQANYLFLHQIKGTPWQLLDQGKARLMTAWEQIDYGQQFTTTRKFITIIPIVL